MCQGQDYAEGRWLNLTVPELAQLSQENGNVPQYCVGERCSRTMAPPRCGDSNCAGYWPSPNEKEPLNSAHWDHGHVCIEAKMSLNMTSYEATRSLLKYKWQPDTCDLVPWDADTFCRLLGERIISFYGDSTMAQVFASLTSLLITHFRTHRTEASRNCVSQLHFFWSDRIDYSSYPRGRGLPFAETWKSINYRNRESEEPNQDIVVVSAGAHTLVPMGSVVEAMRNITTVEQLLVSPILDFFFPKVGDALEFLTDKSNDRSIGKLKPKSVIIKLMSPPHPNCGRYSAPIDLDSDVDRDYFHSSTSGYHWEAVAEADRLMTLFADKYPVGIIDMRPLMKRPDAHAYPITQDCMHYCIPGPLDLFANLLLHALSLGEA
ncbi:hypothetical protein B484DRAFT_391847 [Ochromonadaceae sp. CCMP2298]|nr:hypothetical protein B484DRAFT_391847 [Ochromonadaceae sp. CCMP2298]